MIVNAITTIATVALCVLPALILWRAFSFKYISHQNLIAGVVQWVVAMGLGITMVVVSIEWTGELLINLVGIALILIGVIYTAALLALLFKYNDDTEDRERHHDRIHRQSVGS